MILTQEAAQAHWDFLWTSMRSRTEVDIALGLQRGLDEKQLARLLRDHRPKGCDVTDWDEVEQRDAFDSTLEAFSLLTIAIIAGQVPGDLGANPVSELKEFLSCGPVRRYYEEYYPILLPIVLRRHVTGEFPLPQEGTELSLAGFQWLVRFSGRFTKDPNLKIFLGLLDGFSDDTLNISSFLETIKNPSDALAGVLKRPDQLTLTDSAVLGMLRFLTFCSELQPALEAMSGAPLTQSACWFYYAYWFKEFKEDVGIRIETCLTTLEQWLKSAPGVGAVPAKEAAQSVSDARAAFTALADGRYGAPLVNLLKSKVEAGKSEIRPTQTKSDSEEGRAAEGRRPGSRTKAR